MGVLRETRRVGAAPTSETERVSTAERLSMRWEGMVGGVLVVMDADEVRWTVQLLLYPSPQRRRIRMSRFQHPLALLQGDAHPPADHELCTSPSPALLRFVIGCPPHMTPRRTGGACLHPPREECQDDPDRFGSTASALTENRREG